MARINLLPWRDERREVRKKQFITVLVGVLVVAGGLVFLSGQFIDGLLDEQNARNRYLNQEIATLNERIKQVNEIREMRTQILGRMQVIQDLQGNRTAMPRLFDQLVRTLPDGVYYSSLIMQGGRISMSGTAESNNRVSALMRNLEASPWLAGSTLSGVKAVADGNLDGAANQFQLTVRQNRPKAGQEKGAIQ